MVQNSKYWREKNVTGLHWEMQTKKNHTFLVNCVLFWSLAHCFAVQYFGFVPCDLQLQRAYSHLVSSLAVDATGL